MSPHVNIPESDVLVATREATPEELPAAARRVLANALGSGWTGKATYAKVRQHDTKAAAFAYDDHVVRNGVTGHVRDVHKDKVHLGVLLEGLDHQRIAVWEIAETQLVTDALAVGKDVESIAVRLRRWPLAAVGVWNDGKFAFAYAWTAISTARRIGARDLARLVKAA